MLIISLLIVFISTQEPRTWKVQDNKKHFVKTETVKSWDLLAFEKYFLSLSQSSKESKT